MNVIGRRTVSCTILVAVLVAAGAASASAQAPAPAVDPRAIGPQVGATAPPFSGIDQSGRTRTLEAALGAKGAMLVFFRSADW